MTIFYRDNFFVSWGFYDTNYLLKHFPDDSCRSDQMLENMGRDTNQVNILFAIPLIGVITGIGYTIFSLASACSYKGSSKFQMFLNGIVVKAALSALSLGPLLLFVDLAIFFKRLYDVRANYDVIQAGLRLERERYAKYG